MAAYLRVSTPGSNFTRKTALRCIKSRTGAEASNSISLGDEAGNITVPEQYIGADDRNYGAIYITSSNADASSYYDAAAKTYYFNCRYIVSAGSFGTFYEKFELKNPAQ